MLDSIHCTAGEWVPSQCSQKYLKRNNSVFPEKAEWHGCHFHFTDGHFHVFTLVTGVKKVGLYFTFFICSRAFNKLRSLRKSMAFTQTKRGDFNSSLRTAEKCLQKYHASASLFFLLHFLYPFLLHFLYPFLLLFFPSYHPAPPLLHVSLSCFHQFYLITWVGNTFEPQLKTQHSDWIKGEPTFLKSIVPRFLLKVKFLLRFLLIYCLREHYHFSLGSLLWFPKREHTCTCMDFESDLHIHGSEPHLH